MKGVLLGPEIGEAVAQGSGYALASAAAVAMMLMVGFLVLARSPSSLVSRSFMGMVIACCLWMGGRAGTFGSLTPEEAASWYRLSFVGLAFLPSAVFLFAASAAVQAKRWLKAIVALLTMSSGLSLFSFVRPGAISTIVANPFTGWYARFTIGGYIFIAWLVVVTIFSAAILLRSSIPSSAIQRREKTRIRVILIALAAGYTALFDFLPAIGFGHPPIAHFSLLVGIVLCGYAVGRYRVVVLTPSAAGDAIASTMQEALFFMDLEGRILFTNRALNSLLGYREEDLNGREWKALFAPEMPVELDLGAKGRGLAGVRRATLQTRTGGRISATITVRPYFDEDGDTTGFVGLALEQTEATRLENRVDELETEIKAIFSTSMFGVYMLSGGTLQSVNDRAASMLGYTREEMPGIDLRSVIHPEDLNRVMSRVAMRERGENPENHYVLRALHKNGGTRYIEIFSMSVPRNGEFVILGLALDITQQKTADEEISRAREFSEWILKNSAAGILLADHQGRITLANSTAVEILGAESTSSVEGRHIRDTLLGNDPDVSAFFEDGAEGDAAELPGLANHRLKTGGDRPLFLSLLASPPAAGMEGDFLLMIDRVPEAGAAPISGETVSLGPGAEWMRLILASVSREIGGLLGGILGYASLARALLPAEEKVSGYIDSIAQSARKTLDITGRFGHPGPAQSGEAARLDVNEVVDTVVEQLRSNVSSPIEIDTSLADELPPVPGVSHQLTEALLQLGVNAVDAMPEGGRLGFATREVHLDTSADGRSGAPRHGRCVCVEVIDSGTGIPEDVRDQIFDPFFTTKHTAGAGVGLYLARSIVGNHGGSIFVDSRPGEGSVFRVCLPLSTESPESTEKDIGGSEKNEGHVLIVDDEPAVREVGSELLEELGYEVHTAPDGAEALDLIEKHKSVDVVVLDMVMPRLNGEQTFNRLQDMDPSIKVVISSGYTEDEKVRELLERGATAFVQKPYRAQTMARAVREAMRLRSVSATGTSTL